MGVEDDVRKINRKLDNMVSNGSIDSERAIDLLARLKDIQVTLEILQATGIGLTVNSLRKKTADDTKVSSLAKSIVKAWKKLLNKQSSTNSSEDGPKEKKRKVVADGGCDSEEDNKGSDSNHTSSSPDNVGTTASSNPSTPSSNGQSSSSLPESMHTTDAVRLKCRELLVTALKIDPQPQEAVDHELLAASIEDCIYCEFTSTDSKYKNRIRSRYLNLKDPKNPGLRYNVLCGEISASQIAKMTAEEMASEEMKEIRQKLSKEAMNDHQMAKNEGTKTDLIKCIRCKKYNCSYNQMQTRSADEPMTTFVFCNLCGTRWKFC